MKAKIISVFLAVLLMGLFLPGCVSKAELEECRTELEECKASVAELTAQKENLEAQAANQTAEIANLKSEVGTKDARIAELEKEVDELKKQIPGLDTDKVKITFEPNPVPCKDGSWHWKVVLTEVNGVGVNLKNLIMYVYRDDNLLDTLSYGVSSIEKWCDSAYLLPYGSASVGAGFPCQAITHEIVTITGIDDNGHEITATGRVDFIR